MLSHSLSPQCGVGWQRRRFLGTQNLAEESSEIVALARTCRSLVATVSNVALWPRHLPSVRVSSQRRLHTVSHHPVGQRVRRLHFDNPRDDIDLVALARSRLFDELKQLTSLRLSLAWSAATIAASPVLWTAVCTASVTHLTLDLHTSQSADFVMMLPSMPAVHHLTLRFLQVITPLHLELIATSFPCHRLPSVRTLVMDMPMCHGDWHSCTTFDGARRTLLAGFAATPRSSLPTNFASPIMIRMILALFVPWKKLALFLDVPFERFEGVELSRIDFRLDEPHVEPFMVEAFRQRIEAIRDRQLSSTRLRVTARALVDLEHDRPHEPHLLGANPAIFLTRVSRIDQGRVLAPLFRLTECVTLECRELSTFAMRPTHWNHSYPQSLGLLTVRPEGFANRLTHALRATFTTARRSSTTALADLLNVWPRPPHRLRSLVLTDLSAICETVITVSGTPRRVAPSEAAWWAHSLARDLHAACNADDRFDQLCVEFEGQTAVLGVES